MYVQRQRERARRKRVVRDYQLPAAFFEEVKKEALLQVPGGARMPRRRKDKGRTLADRLRTLGQFLTRTEYQQFHDNLQAEKDLVYRIKELMRLVNMWMLNGLSLLVFFSRIWSVYF